MGEERKWTRTLVTEGDKQNFPKRGDIVEIDYTGWLYDPSKPGNRGKQFDSSKGADRDPLKTQIGVEKVIKGWDEGVPEMSLGEESILTILGDAAYGAQYVRTHTLM